MDKDAILAEVLKYVDVKSLLCEVVIEQIIFTKLDEFVADTENTFDDSVALMLKPLLKKAVADFVAEKLAELAPVAE